MKKYTDEIINFLKEIAPGKSHVEITEILNEKYNLNTTTTKTTSLLKRMKIKTGISGRFKKGFTPWNKGIKTCIKPKNYRKIGSERLSKSGYVLIKVKNPDVWELKHRFLWKQANGEIPKGSVIIFADGDKNNFDLKNLICITKNELRQLNRYRLKKANSELTKLGIAVVKLKSKLYKVKKEKNDSFKGRL